MATTAQRPELIVIVGPTASGKSDLAMEVAKNFNGEIIAADSRTIYKGVDICTAKPSKSEQKSVPHWGIDLVEPGKDFSAHKFKLHALSAIKDIQARDKLPILVGGTGLYVDSILFDYEFVDSSINQRAELEKLNIGQLQQNIKNNGYKMPENHNNRRYLIRTIERKGKLGAKNCIQPNTLVVGLMPSDEELKKRIKNRAGSYFSKGILEETKNLTEKYGKNAILKNSGIAYGASLQVVENKISQPEAIELIQKEEWQYARRQRTWFRRNKFIQWHDDPDSAYKAIFLVLNN